MDTVLVAAGGGLHGCTCASEPASAVAATHLRPVKQGCFVLAEHLALVGSMGQTSSSLEGRPSVHIYRVPSLLKKLLFKPETISASKTSGFHQQSSIRKNPTTRIVLGREIPLCFCRGRLTPQVGIPAILTSLKQECGAAFLQGGRSGTTSESWCVRGVSSFSPASSWGLCAPLGNPAGDPNSCLVAGPSWGCVSNLINKIDEQGLWGTGNKSLCCGGTG